MIGIIDYGSGNFAAIANIYKRLNIEFEIISKSKYLSKADKLILPGVGAFDETMRLLNSSGITEELNKLVLENKVPILGVCVGMHILANNSEEGDLDGLGWIDASVKELAIKQSLPKPHLPHMGWNSVKPLVKHSLLNEIEEEKGFYFLHSYYFSCNSTENVLTTTNYGSDFPSAVFSENIFGVQFHPEKSHSNGVQVFKNFAEI